MNYYLSRMETYVAYRVNGVLVACPPHHALSVQALQNHLRIHHCVPHPSSPSPPPPSPPPSHPYAFSAHQMPW